ncbi:unnamed protein product [Parnassius apollo]|uniref:(apollo) hypothetical protein n=1 Tax=Parnassius apollo TaxID=110799 RepID=A0A8S3Y709_PARAO|nr:unnamed protein product [Parnassius apollo]
MNFRATFLIGFLLVVAAVAFPSEENRAKRDVMDSVKSAWGDVTKAMSDAGDSVANAFNPTEKSALDKMVDGVKNVGQ